MTTIVSAIAATIVSARVATIVSARVATIVRIVRTTTIVSAKVRYLNCGGIRSFFFGATT